MAELNPWWVIPTPRPHARLRLFCFPYAGGSATVFHAFVRALPESVEAASLQLPGRAFRLREPAFTDFDALLNAVDTALTPMLNRPCALWGHSLGALVAFELARKLRDRQAAPVHLFVSGAAAPETPRLQLAPTDLASNAFWSAMHRLYGTPLQVLSDPALLELAVRPLKDDVQVLASYRYRATDPLPCPITAFTGRDDPTVSRTDAEAWRAHTTGDFALHEVPGPHLFLRDFPPQLTAPLLAALNAHATR
jgi:medium-chain acyl-[acyl-carrier-protein] hydrolase